MKVFKIVFASMWLVLTGVVLAFVILSVCMQDQILLGYLRTWWGLLILGIDILLPSVYMCVNVFRDDD